MAARPFSIISFILGMLAWSLAAAAEGEASRPLCPGPDADAAALTAALAGRQPHAELILLAGGDVTLGAHLPAFFRELRERGGDHARDLVGYPFRRLAPLTRSADLFLVNLEGTLTRHREPLEKNFVFRADPRDVALLQAAGVDVVSLANNHAMDFGPKGLEDTLAALGRAGIAAFGAGENLAAARRPAMVERGGVRVGFLGYLHLGDHSVEPPEIYAGPERPGAAGTEEGVEIVARWVGEDVRALRPQVDLLLVVFHWGWEGRNLVEPDQERLALAAAEAGADVVVGHHPHALQGFTQAAGVPVAYSLGNLVFVGAWRPARQEGALLEVAYRSAGAPAACRPPGAPPGRGHVQARLLPLHVDHRPHCPFQPHLLAGAEACRVRWLAQCYAAAVEEGECEAAHSAGG